MAADLDHVIALERALLDPAVRSDPGAVAALLEPDFREVGASGRLWDRDAIVAELVTEHAPAIRDEDMVATELAPDVVLLTYLSDNGVRRARRSSVWRRDAPDGRWRLRYLQGTPVPPAASRQATPPQEPPHPP